MNRLDKARDWMEDKIQGSWAATIEHVLSTGGVFHASPDCVLLAVPYTETPDTLHIIFQCSNLHALRAVLCALPYKRVRWRRDFKNGYEWRERNMDDFCRHYHFGTTQHNKP